MGLSVITLCTRAAEFTWQSISLISFHAHCFFVCLLSPLDGVERKNNMLYKLSLTSLVECAAFYLLSLNRRWTQVLTCFPRSARDRNLFVVIEERNELESLNQSFAELNLFPGSENPTDVVWKFVSNLKHRPYETTMETFSKLTDVFCKYKTDFYQFFNWYLVSTPQVYFEQLLFLCPDFRLYILLLGLNLRLNLNLKKSGLMHLKLRLNIVQLKYWKLFYRACTLFAYICMLSIKWGNKQYKFNKHTYYIFQKPIKIIMKVNKREPVR